MEMTEHQYRTELRRYANSDLSELSNKPRFSVKPETLAFGTVFHAWILEPHKDADDSLISPEQREHLAWMLAAMAGSENEDLINLIHNNPVEQVRCWIDPETGLPLKCKIDSVASPKHLIDLKTTICKTRDAFLQSCLDYDYDRQAAFYLSSDPNAKYFEIVGVQKQPPYAMFRCPFHRDSDFIQGGMRKMRYLLGLAKIEADKENGWRPSSWSRKPEEQV